MSDRSTILADKLTLPPEVAWFNNLAPEERNDFLMGLLNLIGADGSRRDEALNDYLRSWRAKGAPSIGSLDPLSRAFFDKVEQKLDTLLMQKKPTKDLVRSVRKVRAEDEWVLPS